MTEDPVIQGPATSPIVRNIRQNRGFSFFLRAVGLRSFHEILPPIGRSRSVYRPLRPGNICNQFDEDNILASNEGRAYFALGGYHFDPADITRLLGIEPTSVDASGAYSGLDKPVTSSWELSTDTITDDIDVYKLTDIIIKQLEPAKEKILQVIKSHNLSPRIGVVLVLSVDKNESVPDVGFGARTIRFLAEIGAFINVDYQLSKRV